MLRLVMQDKRIMQAIQACPDGTGIEAWPPFQAELTKFLELFLHDTVNSRLVRSRGLDIRDLLCFYASGVATHMPNPFINHGGPMVAPTIFFLETKNIEPILNDLATLVRPVTGREREFAVAAYGAETTERLIRTSTSRSGECTLPRVSQEAYIAQQAGRKAMPILLGVVILIIVIIVIASQ